MSPAATRLGVRLFTVSVGINAALGIVALLGGAFGDLQGRVLATSFLVSAAMGSVLVNVPAQRRPIRPPLPLVGAIGGAGGFSILILVAWIDDVPEPLIKLAASGLTVGAAATLAAALRLVGRPATARWLSAVTEAAIAASVLPSVVATIFIAKLRIRSLKRSAPMASTTRRILASSFGSKHRLRATSNWSSASSA